MRNLFVAPKMNISIFEKENIITASGETNGERAASVAQTRLTEMSKGMELKATLDFTF